MKILQIWCDGLEQWTLVCRPLPSASFTLILAPIDSTAPDAIWAMLTSSERSKFMAVFNNPSGDLAQQLLASESLEKEIQDPWWEPKDDIQIKEDLLSPPRHKAKPRLMEVPLSMINPNPTGHTLLYNICGILYMDSFSLPSRHH